MIQNFDQFFVINGDVIGRDKFDDLRTETLVTLLCLAEREHPGILTYTFRQIALAMNGWKLSSKSSNPQASMIAQNDILATALQFQKYCEAEDDTTGGIMR